VNLTKVDKLILQTQAHWHLDESDDCYFYGEYTARAGCHYSETNQLIFNFKKGLERQANPYEYRYKTRAISDAASMLRGSLANEASIELLRSATLVPIPPSRAKNDPLYDDRVVRMLRLFSGDLGLDIRELVEQRTTMASSHSSSQRSTPQGLAANYQINNTLLSPPPTSLWVFDDVLTTGAHFRAMKSTLANVYPGVPCLGIFLARRVPDSAEL
jgi:hypothetical protein